MKTKGSDLQRFLITNYPLKDPVVYTHKELIEASKAGHRKAQFQLSEAFTKLQQFRYDSSFGAWLKRIVVNRSLNFLRDRKVVFSEWENSANQFVDVSKSLAKPDLDQHLNLAKVKSAMTQLPHGYRQIINLYLIEGYDHVEISEILNISNGTSKSQYHRAKKKLIEIVNTL